MNEVIIRYEGNDVIIRGPKEILKIVIDPGTSIQRITGPEKLDIKVIDRESRKILKKQNPRKDKPLARKTPKSPKGKRLTQDDIRQIQYMRDEEHMTSAQIAKELKISLPTCNKYYRPATKEKI